MDEIVTLSFGNEMSFVTSLVLDKPDSVACGFAPDRLHKCSLSHAAIRAHGLSCARRVGA